ncbi:uncharacterized protein PAC_15991 [Phialocephala subalpina]|uniref:BTB domain-containing protein n=1 Tax=Phialocephala subalpina TaxID=576137 RepID=A0A1L7XM07_9HELO|nr:uncharacterized protein PAC_15991 [Phialocephala subalpina]
MLHTSDFDATRTTLGLGPRMTTLSHVITTTATPSGEEHTRISLNLGEPCHPDTVMSGSSSGIPPATGTDSGYASVTDGSHGSFCKGLIAGIAIPGSKLWSQKVKLKVFSQTVSEAAENRYADLMEFIPKGLDDYLLRARLGSKNISMGMRVLGEDEATASPWIFIQCDKAYTTKIKHFFKQDHIKSEYHPTSNDELMPPFRIFLCERPPRKIAATDEVDVYGQSHIGLATSSAPCCIRVIHPNGSSHIGTLGGVVKILTGDGIFQLYGMTVGHIFAGDDFLDDDSELYESMEVDEGEDSSTDDEDIVELELASLEDDDRDTSIEEEFTETAMNLDYDDSGLRENNKTHSVMGLGTDDLPEAPWSKLGRLVEVSGNTADHGMNFDWALVAIEDFLLYDSMAGTELIHVMQVDGKLKESHEAPDKRRSSKAVTVSGGASGIKDAILSASWSYLQLAPGKSLVRTYTLTLSNYRELQEGDCGAWVVDNQTYELYGYVVASGIFGEAYVLPLESSFKNVKDQLGAQDVYLPEAFEVASWLLRASYKTLEPYSSGFRDSQLVRPFKWSNQPPSLESADGGYLYGRHGISSRQFGSPRIKMASRAGQNRKTPAFNCECGEDADHATQLECDRDRKLKLHRSITAKITPFCPTIPIFVGADKQLFNVQKELLTLHSGYFKNQFKNQEEDDEEKPILLPTVKPPLFADFVAWMYTATFLKLDNDAFGGGAQTDHLWGLGSFLRAPAFQNFCMDDCREYCKDPNNPWPVLSYIELMYKIGDKGSKLRLFAAHSVLRRHPLKSFEKGSEEYKAWEGLFEEWPDLLRDMNKAAVKKWNGAFPWDDELRDEYMEKEGELDVQWEEQILGRGLENIKRDSKEKCVRSIVELDHLQRKKNRGRA